MAVLCDMVWPGQLLTGMIHSQLESVKHLFKSTDDKNTLPVRLGFGIKYTLEAGEDAFVATVAGPLVFANPCRFWIGCRRKVYYPNVGDLVLGVITVKTAEYYKVDLGWAQPATLPAVEGFSAANRRNRPNLPVGSVVFCRVTFCHRDLDPQVTCVEAEEEIGLGPIKPSPALNLFSLPVSYAEDLQRIDSFVLAAFGKRFSFEIIVGCNGKMILETATPALTKALGEAIIKAELLTEREVQALAAGIIKELQ